MGRVLTAGEALALFVVAACTGSGEPSAKFVIKLQLDGSQGSFCGSTSCLDYGMSCGAQLAIDIYDVMRDLHLVHECKSVPAADSICRLDNIDPKIFVNIPTDQVRISVAAWRPGVLPGGHCPADDIFDERGVPRANFMPQPAFGGAIYFDVGSTADVAEVSLSCTDAFQLDDAECTGTAPRRVVAHVDDIWTGLDVTADQASQLTVGVAPPRQVPGFPTSQVVIDRDDTIDLDREDGAVPTFAAELDEPLDGTRCTVVLDSAPAESTSDVVCYDVDGEANPLEVPGVLVPKERLDAIMGALALDDFPSEGLVVGRVVDHTGIPLAGVAVTPDVPGGADAVEYLSADLTAVEGPVTSTSGFFASRTVPFGTRWTAVHEGDGRREDGETHAGLVRDKVSAVVLRMQPP
ncbi:MAG TPA: hypothetical protein VKB80_18880 [Kofleriaceae bacterium]|nr:hypothetical protein [Kofleriaceae bacterium]